MAWLLHRPAEVGQLPMAAAHLRSAWHAACAPPPCALHTPTPTTPHCTAMRHPIGWQAAIGAELEAKNKLEDVLKKRREEQRMLEDERNAIKRVRGCVRWARAAAGARAGWGGCGRP